jgi:hypothetical protein
VGGVRRHDQEQRGRLSLAQRAPRRDCGGAPRWRKASYSGGADCVETGSVPGVVLIRDTKDRERGPVLRVSPEAWRVFTRGVKGRN